MLNPLAPPEFQALTTRGLPDHRRIGAAFLPTVLSGLVLWLDASQLTGLVNLDPVASWTDLSGLGNHAVQATAGKKPTYRTNILNGKPIIRFDATDDGVVTPSLDLTATQGVTMLAVVGPVTSGGTRIIAELTTNFNSFTTGFVLYRTTTNFLIADLKGDVGTSTWTSTATLIASAAVASAVWDKALASSFESQNWLNGAQTGSIGSVGNNTNFFGNAALNIGSRANGGSLPLSGDIAELMLYSRSLTAAERRRGEAYLGAKWGITVV